MIRELRNLLTSACAIIIILVTFLMINRLDFVPTFAKVIYKVPELFGLVQTDPMKGPHLPILSTNVLLFLLLNIIFGYLAYILIKKWGTIFPGIFNGIIMVAVFFIITYTNSVNSIDKAAEPFAYIGTFLVAFIQLPLSQILIKRSVCKKQ